MYTVEFETIVKDKTISIPDEHNEFELQNVKVIVTMANHNNFLEERKPGTAKGRFIMADDFERPLDEETLELFYK